MPFASTTTSPRFVCATATSATADDGGSAVAFGAGPMLDEHATAAAATSTQASMVNGVFIWGPHSRCGCGTRAAPTTTSRSPRWSKTCYPRYPVVHTHRVGPNGEVGHVSTLAASSEGGGAALDQVIGMTLVGAVVFAALAWIGYLHRNRRITWLTGLGEAFGRRFKRPPWVALPIAMFIATIICALFGFIWDVSLHIGNGRDPGPLANPAHYFI